MTDLRTEAIPMQTTATAPQAAGTLSVEDAFLPGPGSEASVLEHLRVAA